MGLAEGHTRGSAFEALILDLLCMLLQEVVAGVPFGQMTDLELEALILDQPCKLAQVGLPFLI